MPSNVIRDFVYAADRHELTVNFVSGKVYVYSLVPAQLADAFAESVSPGAFFNTRIRDRYPFRRERSQPRARPAESSLLEKLMASREG